MRRTAAGLAVLLCAACGGADPAGPAASSSASSSVPSSATPSPGPAVLAVPGIEAEVRQWRTDEAVGGQVQVTVTDTGAEPFTVTSVAIDSAGFAPLPDRAVDVGFTPGRTFDLPAQYGAVVCERAAEPAAARLTVVRPDGRTEQLLVPLAAEVLTRIHTEACAVQAVLAVADVAVTGVSPDGDAVTGTLTLTRTGDDDRPVTVTRLEGNVLYAATADLPRTLEAGESTLEVGVEFTMGRCDPHALAEVKQPYAFLLGLQVGGEDEVPADLPLDQGQRDELAALVDRVCG
ncbi:hypothetical protein JOD57_002041 [Geodermatophilus bullaregiensis]|uniref:hypothetical protein n=1 Tax=Geodermatophilus bullaregiensis TaxID=1564160 RepID=UPI001959B363|nr:hypothetical protein [Geodermatophilus bullaregiensis]MBM7806204.1 hypothetical protein [Geodermatophilus bullaregiensis]